MIAFRKAHLTLVYGDFDDLLPEYPQLYCYRRWDKEASFIMVHNFSDQPTSWAMPEGNYDFILGNYAEQQNGALAPWESRVYRLS